MKNEQKQPIVIKDKESPTDAQKKIEFFKKLGLKIRERKVSNETAHLIFEAILYKYDIKFSDIVIEDGEEAAETKRNKFVRAIEYGRMSFEKSDDPKKGYVISQVEANGKTIEYIEYNGTASAQAGKGKGGPQKIYELLGSLSGKGAEYIKKMDGEDLRLAEEIANIFFL